MKHRILRLYLNPWLKKISTVNSDILYVDGFAGPGVYPDGSDGSPIIAMEMANKILSESERVSKRVETIRCVFIEKDSENFAKLEESVGSRAKELDDRIDPVCINGEFEGWANDFINEFQDTSPPPGLVFIDPFGYSNIPFELISDLYRLRDCSLELLITFMAGKMAQWMVDQDHQKAISDTLGIDDWQTEVPPDMSKDERAEQFSSIYQRELQERAGAAFTMPFEMVEETKKQVCYYLIHVTNHWEGLKVMKETMFNAGADDKFAYLGPDHSGYEDEQLSFAEFAETDNFEERIEDFAQELYSKYKGTDIIFQDLLEDTFDENVFKVSHYREAFKILKENGKLEVEHRPNAGGNESRGFGRPDRLVFVNMSLGNFV